MRQFILAKQFVTDIDLATAAVGDLGIVYSSKLKTDKAFTNLALVTENGPILFPIYKNDITCSVAEYKAGAAYTATFTIAEVSPYLDYVVTFVKKGKQFNERNKWSAVIHTKATDTAETVAAAIVKFVTENPTLGLTATAEGANVTVTGTKVGEGYTITFGEELYGTQLTSVTVAKVAQGDAAYVRDLFEKCAANRGFEYTGEDLELYPGYTPHIEEGEYSVLTIRFTEPRRVGTREEAVYQIIHVVGSTTTVNAVHAEFFQF